MSQPYTVVSKAQYYEIQYFPISAFERKIQNYYRTTRLQHLYEALGIKIFGFKRRNYKGHTNILVHKFFIPEMVYLLEKFRFPQALIATIRQSTYLANVGNTSLRNTINIGDVYAEMNFKLLPYQQEFIESYAYHKHAYSLNGYILAFEQGLGKTLTALGLMVALKKDVVIIVAPKSVLNTVWKDHIVRFFHKKKVISCVTDGPLDAKADYIIVNYESMDKLDALFDPLIRSRRSIGIIVDESHNFLRKVSNRTQNLITLPKKIGCTDTLLMSGTPIKAIGLELVPMLMVLDPYFDEEAFECFKRAFGLNTLIASEVLHARLSIMMHRKTKDEVLNLPPKNDHLVQVKLPNGKDYTMENVQRDIKSFVVERMQYHREHANEYAAEFNAAIDWLKKHPTGLKQQEFQRYLSIVEWLKKAPVNLWAPDAAEKVKWANEYEKNVITALLPPDLKKGFIHAKSAIKYVHLKIKGEVIGQFLTRKRIQMTTELIEAAQLINYIREAIKKSVIFTSYVDSVEATDIYMRRHGQEPILVYGKTSNDVVSLVNKFMQQPQYNPLIATIQTLSTGVTLTIASTVIFLNAPWRHVLKEQASDRVHRIGQDTEVDIYTLVLDTGDAPNLSTRMEDILEWSKELFNHIVGGEEVVQER